MPKVLIVHGAGMNMRGKAQIDVFGPMLLPEYDDHIRKYAAELGVEVEIFHSNIEGEVINKFYDAHERGFDGAIIRIYPQRLIIFGIGDPDRDVRSRAISRRDFNE